MNVPQRMHFEKDDKCAGYMRCFSKIQTPVFKTNKNTTIARFDIKMNIRRSCSENLFFKTY